VEESPGEIDMKRKPPLDFSEDEVDSIYTDPRDRFIVSFIVGYGEMDEITTLKEAAEAALNLTTDAYSDGTVWFVYDRQTETLRQFTQRQFDPQWVSGDQEQDRR
jgi:hypothetical protein